MLGVLVLVSALVVVGLMLLARDGVGDASDPLSVEKASATAFDATGGGRATEVESIAGEGVAWEVDVIMPDGSTFDVLLDRHFRFVGMEKESE